MGMDIGGRLPKPVDEPVLLSGFAGESRCMGVWSGRWSAIEMLSAVCVHGVPADRA